MTLILIKFQIFKQKMRKILSLSNRLNKQLPNYVPNPNLTFQSRYYARSSKRSTQKRKDSQNLQKNAMNKQGNQSSNQSNPNEPQPNKQVHLRGPKQLMQQLKKGNPSLIPFYLRNMIGSTRNPSLPFEQQITVTFKQELKTDEEPQKQNQFKPNEQKSSKQAQFPTKTNESQIPFQPLQSQAKIEYTFKSSSIYKERLMKKYKIIQALKTTRKLSAELKLFQFLRDPNLNLEKILKDPAQKSFFFRVIFYSVFLITFFLYSGKNIDKILPYPDAYLERLNDMTQLELSTKLNDVKEINVKTNSHHDNELTLVFNEERKLNIFEQIKQLLGFEVQKNKSLTFDVQNPNLILDGLEKVQQNRSQQDWVKIKPLAKNYSYYDAFFDTLFLATPFIGLAITYWIFTKVNPDSMLKGLSTNKKSMKIQSTKDIKVRFKDVAGMENAKKQITEFVDFLKHSEKYVQMGAKIPKGALLTGPPGTGKTMLAKACAGQAGTSFFYVSGSEFVEMFVGLGASRVRQLFAKARQQAPSIIFIDEIDAIGKKRETSRNEEKDSTLNQMLVEMDGFSTSETIIVLAATNRKDILDNALTRPGRFDRMVQITLPELKARQEIFMVHLTPLKVNPNKPLTEVAKRLAELTPGFSGADIANLCNEAAIIATRKQRQYIEDADFEEASQRIMAGYVKKGLSNEKTKKRVAYHEAGHAVCGWYLRGGDPLVKLTIIPRSKGALGYAQYLPKTAYIRTKSELIDQIAIMLGGTTSEQIFLNSMSSGNSDDLQKVYSLARRMITQFGMGQKTYNMTLDEQTYVRKQSENLCNIMDSQVLQIVNQATNRAKKIIQEKRDIVEQLATELLAKETINNEDILRIMGQRPVFN